MSRWIVYGCFGFTWLYSIGCLLLADRPAEVMAAVVAVIVVPLCMIPMCEEAERWVGHH